MKYLAGYAPDLLAAQREYQLALERGEDRDQRAPGRSVRSDILTITRETAAVLGFEPQLGLSGPIDTVVTGTLAEKVQQLNDALKSGALPGLRKDFVDLNDIDVPRGSTPPWSELRAIQRLS